MTAPESVPASAAPGAAPGADTAAGQAPAALPPPPVGTGSLTAAAPSWRGPVLLIGGGLLAADLVRHLLQGFGDGLLGAGALTAGAWLLWRRRSRPLFEAPLSHADWVARCERVLDQFERLGCVDAQAQAERRDRLDRWRSEAGPRPPRLALVGSRPPSASLRPAFAAALSGRSGLLLDWGDPLPRRSGSWDWPEHFQRSDVFLHHLHTPLTAADLRWLEAVPAGLPVWLLVEGAGEAPRAGWLEDLHSQWPGAVSGRCLLWDGRPQTLSEALRPLADWLSAEAAALRAATPLRGLEALHRSWQRDLEALRRREWQRLQQRTQWLVAAAVFASPVPSVDLLVLAAANGLMLQEMARLWDCPWTLSQLREAAGELARAALAQGVVEWTSQALAGAIRLDGATWLVGGGLQALSAAYLTRVVGLAMADLMALSSGVAEPDLEAVKRQAPLLVARAAEAGRLDWRGFLQQGRRWLEQQGGDPPALHLPS